MLRVLQRSEFFQDNRLIPVRIRQSEDEASVLLYQALFFSGVVVFELEAFGLSMFVLEIVRSNLDLEDANHGTSSINGSGLFKDNDDCFSSLKLDLKCIEAVYSWNECAEMACEILPAKTPLFDRTYSKLSSMELIDNVHKIIVFD